MNWIVTATVGGETISRSSASIGLNIITNKTKITMVENNKNNSSDDVENEKPDQRKIAAEHTKQCRVNTKLQLEQGAINNAIKKQTKDHQQEIAVATQINEQLCKELEAKGDLIKLFSNKFDEQCNETIRLSREKISTATMMRTMIRDQQVLQARVEHLQIQLEDIRTKKDNSIEKRNKQIKQLAKEVEVKRELVTEIASKMQINEQLCIEVEAKGQLVTLFSQKFEEQSNNNIELARDKMFNATVMKGLIRDKNTRAALVDHLYSQIEQLTMEVEVNRELVTNISSKMKKLKVCKVELKFYYTLRTASKHSSDCLLSSRINIKKIW